MKIAYVCDHCASTVIASARDLDHAPQDAPCLYSGRNCRGRLRREAQAISQQLRASHRCRRGRLEVWHRHVPEAAQEGVGAAFGKFWKETMNSVKRAPEC